MTYVLLLALLVGPPQEVGHRTVYVLIDSKDTNPKHADVVAKSQVVLAELSRLRLKPVEQLCIEGRWKVVVEEFETLRLPYKPPIPSFKFLKNAEYQSFCPGTFSGSWTFARSFRCILEWEEYLLNFSDWQSSRNEFQYFRKWEPKEQTSIWRDQPPDHPEIFPRLPGESIAFRFYGYANRILLYNGDIRKIDIDTEDGLGTMFYAEYADQNIWFAGVKDEDKKNENNYSWGP